MWEDKRRGGKCRGRGERESDFESCSRGEPLGAARPQLKELLWSDCWKIPRRRMENGQRESRYFAHVTGHARSYGWPLNKCWKSPRRISLHHWLGSLCHSQGQSRKKFWAPFTPSPLPLWLLSESVKVQGGVDTGQVHAAFPGFLPSEAPRIRERQCFNSKSCSNLWLLHRTTDNYYT